MHERQVERSQPTSPTHRSTCAHAGRYPILVKNNYNQKYMRTKIAINLVIIAFFIVVCSFMNESRVSIDIIYFGKGGGFTGIAEEFALKDNGKLVKIEVNKTEKSIKLLSKKEVLKYFKKAKSLNINNINFNHPSNMYYFVATQKAEKEKHIITWGDNLHPISPEIQSFYNELIQLTK